MSANGQWFLNFVNDTPSDEPHPDAEWSAERWADLPGAHGWLFGPPDEPSPPANMPPLTPSDCDGEDVFGIGPYDYYYTYNGSGNESTEGIVADDVISLDNNDIDDAIIGYLEETQAEETMVDAAPTRGDAVATDTSVAFTSAEDVADIAVDVDVF